MVAQDDSCKSRFGSQNSVLRVGKRTCQHLCRSKEEKLLLHTSQHCTPLRLWIARNNISVRT